jgi:hypothetical protein
MAIALIALALFLRVLVPVGWMPTEQGFGIRLCTPVAAAADQPAAGMHGQSHHSEHAPTQAPEKAGQPCSFTMLAASLDVAAPPALDNPVPVRIALPQMPAPSRPRHRLAPAAVPPPATGPPTFA